MSKFLCTASVTAALFLTAGAAFADAHAATEPAPGEGRVIGGAVMLSERNIVENAMNSADHTTLVAAVQAAGLADTLQGAGPFTVFAPTNDAFAALPDGTVETLLRPENLATLQTVLTCHVVAAEAFSNALESMIASNGGAHVIETVGGCQILAQRDAAGHIVLMDETGRSANITDADVDQSNGVIHVIDSVLLPAG